MKHFTLENIAEELSLDLDRLKKWVEADLVVASKEGEDTFFVGEDLERFRVIGNLINDLEVNLEGVEVILGMREKMIAMEQWMRKVFKIIDEHKLLTEELLEEFKKF